MTTPLKWLFERNVFTDGNPEKLISLLHAQNTPTKSISYSPGETITAYPPGDNVILYGSIGFVRDMMRTKPWHPTAWFDTTTLSCSHYFPHYADFLLQKNFRFLPLAELQTHYAKLYDDIGIDGHLFIRPDDALKSFAGKNVPKEKFPAWLSQNIRCYDPPPTLICLIAQPQQILNEWRLIIAHNKILTGSAYIAEDRSAISDPVPQDVLTTAEEILTHTDFHPFPIYTLDLARTSDGLSLLELGSINCSSLYHCNLEKIITAITTTAQSEPLV